MNRSLDGSTASFPAKQVPPFSFINNIFKDMKPLIHPIAILIASINTRLNDMDKQVASNTALSSPVFATPVMACILAQHFRSPQLTIPTYNLASAALNGP
ncbi:UNVERIFIED_CONTAM: hypothetical protein FKN15_045446 [Acipenser sinensis]